MTSSNTLRSSQYLLALFDLLIVVVVGITMFSFLLAGEPLLQRYANAIAAFALVVVLCSAALGLYDGRRSLFSWNVFRRLVYAWFVIMATIALVAVVTKSNYSYSRSWFISTSALSFLCSLLMRIVLNRRAREEQRQLASRSDILVVGAGGDLDDRVGDLLARAPFQYREIKTWNWQSQTAIDEQLEALKAMAERMQLSQLWVLGRGLDQQATKSVLSEFNSELIQLSYYPDFTYLPVIVPQLEDVHGVPAIRLSVRPLSTTDRWLKTMIDKLFALGVIVCLSPLLVLIALGVKFSSPGPILYRQERMTINGRIFNMLKFRSMPVGVEQDSGPVWAKEGEDRATRFGSFLRQTSLDELPQFFNVLLGDMSVVGPRPERPHFVEEFYHSVPAYMQKHAVRAGITGWAQINGLRGNTSIEKRIEHDIFYIQNWSIWLDIKIIVMTIFKGLVAKTAY